MLPWSWSHDGLSLSLGCYKVSLVSMSTRIVSIFLWSWGHSPPWFSYVSFYSPNPNMDCLGLEVILNLA